MPFCKTCGTLYTKSLGVCPKCSAEEALRAQPEPAPMPPEEGRRVRRRRWIGICIGIPALIAFIYLMYYVRFLLKS